MTNSSFKILFLFGFLSTVTYSFSQYTLSGKLTDDNGEALIGATVKIASLSLGTSTDVEGNYMISNIANGQHNVIYSAVGFKTVNVLVDFNGDVQRDLSFAEDALLLDEAVVIGYGTARTKDLTGSAVIVKSEDFNKGSVTTPEQLVMGKIPGVKINSNNGAPGSGSTIRIRGGTSINASNDPLIVIDGVPLDNGGVAGACCYFHVEFKLLNKSKGP
ncbi:MAG: carboxypeptidase-like regulatory domain-containing protein [Bacteroidota bacterium]|nr:carboxypeptidase-like regulatory domain-containing protein [Bacteroidota bacterium]